MNRSKVNNLSRLEISKADFRFSIPNISTFKFQSSDQVLLRGLPWCIEVRRYESKSKDSTGDQIGIGLICRNTDDSPDWSCAASAEIQLLSFNRDQPLHKHILEPSIFNAERRARILKTFIKWTDLIDTTKGYVKNGQIEFNVNIKVGAVSTTNCVSFATLDTCCENATMVKFQLKIPNITDLMIVQSPLFTLRNMPWQMSISNIESSGYLKIGLCCNHEDTSSKWSCETTLSVQLIPCRENMAPLERRVDSFVICNEKQSLAIGKFLPWHQLIDPQNGFVENDSICFDVEIKTGKPNCVKPKPKERRLIVELDCPICERNMLGKTVSATKCGHLFCTMCIEEHLKSEKTCVYCNRKIELKQLRRISLYR